MAITDITKENYEQFLSSDYAVIDFFGSHCGPCKMLAPVYHELADDLAGVNFGTMCTDENYDFSKELGIQFVPTVRFYRDGKQVAEFSGYKERAELNEYMAKLLYE